MPAASWSSSRGLVRHVVTVPIAGSEAALDAPARWLPSPVASAWTPSRPPTSRAAIRYLQERDGEPLRILICGSLYLAGQVLALQEGVQAQMN